jgi:PAS domain S-box-containing protein
VETPEGEQIYQVSRFPWEQDGKYKGVMSIFRNISQQIKQEEEHQRVLWFLDSIIDNIPIMLFVKEAKNLQMCLWNKAGSELIGFSKEEMVGRTDFDFFPEEQAKFFQSKDREVLSGKQLIAVEEPIQTRHGDRWLFTKKIPLLDESGTPKYLLGISEDITERKQTLEELKSAKEAAEQANRVKSEFLTNISHELRTPLTLIASPIQALLEEESTSLSPAIREQLERVARNTARLTHLVNELLDWSKIEAGHMRVHPSPCSPQLLLKQLVDDALPTARARKIDLQLLAENDPYPIKIDPAMFEKIALNLISNALKFTPEGGKVTVVLQYDSQAFRLVVNDTGVGIPAEAHHRLFTKFQQIDSSATRRYEGTGLGLALVKEFCVLMNGSVDVESTVGQGSTFTVSLPLSAEVSGERRAIRPGSTSEPPSSVPLTVQATSIPMSTHFSDDIEQRIEVAHKRYHILLAEDNPDMRAYIAGLLKPLYRLTLCENGKQALERARSLRPDLILSDVMMPEMSGMDLVAALKSDPAFRTIPILLLTARTGQNAIVSGLEAGADDYLCKPFSPDELRARIVASLRLHQLYHTLHEVQSSRDRALEQARLAVSSQLARCLQPWVHGFQFADIPQDSPIFELEHFLTLLSEPVPYELAPSFNLQDLVSQIKSQALLPCRTPEPIQEDVTVQVVVLDLHRALDQLFSFVISYGYLDHVELFATECNTNDKNDDDAPPVEIRLHFPANKATSTIINLIHQHHPWQSTHRHLWLAHHLLLRNDCYLSFVAHDDSSCSFLIQINHDFSN